MNILVWGINYAPEVAGIAPFNAALCEYLVSRGHNVTMLTTFSYYPQWKKRPEDAGQPFRRETINGVNVIRVWHYVPQNVSSARRILHEASFLATSLLASLSLEKIDRAVVVSPPLGLGVTAWLFSRIKNVPFIFHVQDLQPDAAVSLGMLKPSLLTRLLYKLEAFAYRKASKISGISQGMIKAFKSKGVPPEKIVHFPNGVKMSADTASLPRGLFRQRLNIAPETCIATYSGNLGKKQGLDILLDVAEKLVSQPIRIIICGDGAQRQELAQLATKRNLQNVSLLPLQDDKEYREMQIDTTISLITQQKGTGQFFFPSKLLSALVFGKPVIAVADSDSELAVAMQEAQCGIVVSPGDVDGLAAAFLSLSDPARQAAMGQNGTKWVAQYAFDRVHANFENELLNLKPPHE